MDDKTDRAIGFKEQIGLKYQTWLKELTRFKEQTGFQVVLEFTWGGGAPDH